MQIFLKKSILHVQKMFPEIYRTRPIKGSYHWAMAYDGNKLIAVGINKPERVDARALEFARRFNLKEKLKFPYLHSEEHLIARLIGMDKLSPSLNIVVIRMNKFGELGNSKPCENCSVLLTAYGLNRIWYSDEIGEICHV